MTSGVTGLSGGRKPSYSSTTAHSCWPKPFQVSHFNAWKLFSSALLKLRWLGPNASGWNLGFIRCCLRKNTYASSRKDWKQKQGLGLLFGDRLLKVSWKQNDFKLQKNYQFDFLFGVIMVIVFVPISWTTGLFLQHPPFGKMYAFQMLPCGSHLIILIPLLGSALLAFFLKMPLDPQSHIGTLSKHSRNWVCFRKSSFPAKCQRLTFLCPVTAIDILFLTLIFSSLKITFPICSISVVCVFLYMFSNYLGNKAEYKQRDK